MQYVIKTDIGIVRKENQDSALVLERDGITFAILCDGMGGHVGGGVASRITVDKFGEEFMRIKKINDSFDWTKWFRKTMAKAIIQMRKFAYKSSPNLSDMGTTLTACIETKDKFFVYNAGDSRTYFFGNTLLQITNDHTEKHIPIGRSKNMRIFQSGWSYNILTSAIGPTKKAKLDTYIWDDKESVKLIVLTSDGIHEYIPKPTFEKILFSKATLNEKAKKIIRESIKKGSTDNLTIILLKVKHDREN